MLQVVARSGFLGLTEKARDEVEYALRVVLDRMQVPFPRAALPDAFFVNRGKHAGASAGFLTRDSRAEQRQLLRAPPDWAGHAGQVWYRGLLPQTHGRKLPS